MVVKRNGVEKNINAVSKPFADTITNTKKNDNYMSGIDLNDLDDNGAFGN